MEPDALLVCDGLGKGFGSGEGRVEIFSGVSLEVRAGDFLAVVGPSGCGKSTLLHILAGLESPDTGDVLLDGTRWRDLNDERRAVRRGEAIGFVFQLHHLLPELTAEENVALPLFLSGASEAEGRRAARDLLDRVGLSARCGSFPRTLSGGERQRVAIARAVVRKPRLLLCDEPTGSLDAVHAADVFTLLREVARERVGAALVVTHDPVWASRCDRVLRLTPTGLEDGA